MIFVAGTNLDGRHGAGSARYAYEHCGLKLGVARGLCGDSYALPTVGHNFARMTLVQVAVEIGRFLQVAVALQHCDDLRNASAIQDRKVVAKDLRNALVFQVTRVGCNRAGFTDAQIAPLFADAPDNCLFDEAWKPFLPTKQFWGTFSV